MRSERWFKVLWGFIVRKEGRLEGFEERVTRSGFWLNSFSLVAMLRTVHCGEGGEQVAEAQDTQWSTRGDLHQHGNHERGERRVRLRLYF
jgi:hypothetical protein